jgi:hypothetical protein
MIELAPVSWKGGLSCHAPGHQPVLTRSQTRAGCTGRRQGAARLRPLGQWIASRSPGVVTTLESFEFPLSLLSHVHLRYSALRRFITGSCTVEKPALQRSGATIANTLNVADRLRSRICLPTLPTLASSFHNVNQHTYTIGHPGDLAKTIAEIRIWSNAFRNCSEVLFTVRSESSHDSVPLFQHELAEPRIQELLRQRPLGAHINATNPYPLLKV